jgi:phosphopantothenoylcysteine decarboxylase/phosphopantothenate--cysteine ligase
MSKKKILIGISGGIAAYKTLSLIRLCVKNGYEVKVVATQNALEFVTP